MVSIFIFEAILLIALIYVSISDWRVEAQLTEPNAIAGNKLGYYLLGGDNNIDALEGILDKQQLEADFLGQLANTYQDDNYNNGASNGARSIREGEPHYAVDVLNTDRAMGYLVSGPVNKNIEGQEQGYLYLMRRSDYDPLGESISPPVNDPIESQRLALDMIAHQLDNMSYITSDPVSVGSDPILVSMNDNLDESQPINEPISAASNIFADPVVTSSPSPSLTAQHHKQDSEYIDHPLVLAGHQSVQGGAGEGRQLLGPDGTFENVQVIKTDHATSNYCDPPNPCPIGFTAKDGCLEKFVNSASFSREYQAKQECSCDNEHSLFNCAAPITTENDIIKSGVSLIETNNEDQKNDFSRTGFSVGHLNNKADHLNPQQQQQDSDNEMGLATLARAIKNRFGDLDAVKDIVAKQNSAQRID